MSQPPPRARQWVLSLTLAQSLTWSDTKRSARGQCTELAVPYGIWEALPASPSSASSATLSTTSC
eukprot:5556057-Heterocapsa_arctica.AAC.1